MLCSSSTKTVVSTRNLANSTTTALTAKWYKTRNAREVVTNLPVVSGDVVTVLTVLTVGVVTVVGLSVTHTHKHAV